MNKKSIIELALLMATSSMHAQKVKDPNPQWPKTWLSAKPGARWWILGSAWNMKDIDWTLNEYKTHGIGTLEVTPLYGVQGNDKNNIPFLSQKWLNTFGSIKLKTLNLEIEMDMNCGTGWPFGGPNVTAEDGACKLVYSDQLVSNVQCQDLDILPPKEKDRQNAVLQRVMAYYEGPAEQIDESSSKKKKKKKKKKRKKNQQQEVDPYANLRNIALDVTGFAKDGRLVWTPQYEGKWRVIAIYAGRTGQMVKRAAPGGEGLVIDHFDSLAVSRYITGIAAAFKKYKAPWPTHWFNDSYEVFGADWTPTLLEEFKKRRGYQLEAFLPEFLGDTLKFRPQSEIDNLQSTRERVMIDYRETLSDLLLHNFTEQWTEWAHDYGIKTRNQSHGSPANLIDVYAAVDVPEIEGFGLTDFGIKGLRKDPGMTRKNDADFSMMKYASSAAHITAKGLTSSETFTWLTEHFRTSLSQCKPDMDLLFCAGVNHMFYHGLCYSPKDEVWPGWKFYASIDMSPTNSIWRDAPFFNDYITRCQTFLQWGSPNNDYLVYVPIRDMWAKNLDKRLMQFSIHAMGDLAPEFRRSILAIDSLGFDSDYISDKYLLGCTVSNGMIVTKAGTRYKGLVLPNVRRMTQKLADHIAVLKANGAKIYNSVEELEKSYNAVPEQMKTKLHLKAIRRLNEKGYHYFISNLTPNDVDEAVTLAVPFQNAVWFDPMTGERYAAEVKRGDVEGNKVRICLRSGESMILETFNQNISTTLPYRKTQYSNPRVIDGNWTLSFIDEAPKVGEKFNIGNLRTWEGLNNANAKITMGTGEYRTTINMTKEQAMKDYAIDLGDVRESARVYINGKFVGCAWAVPFILNVGKAFKAGENSLIIEVTNLPANRIADLDRKGVQWRKFNEINFVDIHYKKTSYAGWDPVPSGLNSKVTLYEAR